MDRQKMMRQAKVLRDKKLARMARLGKQLRPQVEAGVVKHVTPVIEQSKEVKKFAAPPTPVRAVRAVVPKSQQTPQQQEMRQQNVNPKKIVRKQKGCSGCRRKTK